MILYENAPPQLREALSVMPNGVRLAVLALLSGLRGALSEIREIRLRGFGGSYVVVGERRIPLLVKLCEGELEEILSRLCKDSLYAYRDSISRGYVAMNHGVRVGIAGMARYDGGKIVGISHPSSLVFRIPNGRCELRDRLYFGWRELGMPNLLVISAPGVGKTTALRSLVGMIGAGADGFRVVVVDERCEFVSEDYSGAAVDVLRGYRRATGIDIALRTLSPEVLAVDEVGTKEECDALSYAVGAGVRVIATAHGDSLRSVRSRPEIARLIREGAFTAVAAIAESGAGREVSFYQAKEEVGV